MDVSGTCMPPITSCGEPLDMSTSLTVPEDVMVEVTEVPALEALTLSV